MIGMLLYVDVWTFLVEYVSLMMHYVDDSLGMSRVTCSIRIWPYVLHECNCTCDMVKYVCLVVVDLCPSTWYIKNVNMTLIFVD